MEAVEGVMTFHSHRIESIEFRINPKYIDKKETFNLKPELEFDLIRNDQVGIVIIRCDIFRQEESPFDLKVVIKGGFGIEKVEEGEKDQAMKCNAVTILYPYLRTAIANITSSAGINTLNIPALNVAEMTKDIEVQVIIEEEKQE